ncbi:MAG: sialidase family protein [Pirellulaceae bacterium]
MANRLAYLACVIAAIVTTAVRAEGAATAWSWEYDAACGEEPHAASSAPFFRSSTGTASFTDALPPLLSTFDQDPNSDGRFYYLPRHACFEQRGRLRIEFAVRIVRSEGSPAATCVQVPLLAEPVGPMQPGPLRLGPHGEGHQEFVGRDLRYIMVSFQTNEADPADDELVLFDIANPAEVRELVRHRIPLDVLRTYSVEVVRTGADRAADELRLAVGDRRTEPVAVRLDKLNVTASIPPFGFLFGHPAAVGSAEAHWKSVAISFEPDQVASQQPQHARLQEPIAIAQKRQLFVDDVLIDEARNVRRVLGEPVKHPANPVFPREMPWEKARCELYGSCLYDPVDNTLKLFYSAMSVPYDTKLAYAESSDGGVTWHRPELDVYQWKGQPTNIVWPGRYFVSGPCVLLESDDADASRRFKMFTSDVWVGDMPRNKGPQGISVAFSSDGKHWADAENPVVRDFNSDTGQSVVRDDVGTYIAYIRLRSSNLRSVGVMESTDFVHWTEPRLIYMPEPEDRQRGWEFYGLSVTRCEGLYIGLLWIFPNVPTSTDWNSDAPVTWVELVASRDGIQWHRVERGKPFLPLGPKGTFDARQIRPASSLVVLADRILLLYSGSPHPHVSAHQYDIGLATLRLDGFAAMEAGNEEGTIVTRPLQFPAGRLSINATTQSGGYVKVELLDVGGRPLDAYTAVDCTAFEGDSTRHIVTWNLSGNVPTTPTEGLRLRFTLRHAKLYAFAAVSP